MNPQALLCLYRRGIQPLGHLHSGNIFIEEVTNEDGEAAGQRVCKVGGYENMLLGYRTRLYRSLLESEINMELIDVYLFGKFQLMMMLITCAIDV